MKKKNGLCGREKASRWSKVVRRLSRLGSSRLNKSRKKENERDIWKTHGRGSERSSQCPFDVVRDRGRRRKRSEQKQNNRTNESKRQEKRMLDNARVDKNERVHRVNEADTIQSVFTRKEEAKIFKEKLWRLTNERPSFLTCQPVPVNKNAGKAPGKTGNQNRL